MGKIHNVEKMTDNRFVNLYHVDATSVHNTPVSYYVASRAKDVPALKLKTGRNDPDGVIIYSIYGQKKDKVVLVRQYRYTLGDYIYEFPAGLVEPGEDFHEAPSFLFSSLCFDFRFIDFPFLFSLTFFIRIGIDYIEFSVSFSYRCHIIAYSFPNLFVPS